MIAVFAGIMIAVFAGIMIAVFAGVMIAVFAGVMIAVFAGAMIAVFAMTDCCICDCNIAVWLVDGMITGHAHSNWICLV